MFCHVLTIHWHWSEVYQCSQNDCKAWLMLKEINSLLFLPMPCKWTWCDLIWSDLIAMMPQVMMYQCTMHHVQCSLLQSIMILMTNYAAGQSVHHPLTSWVQIGSFCTDNWLSGWLGVRGHWSLCHFVTWSLVTWSLVTICHWVTCHLSLGTWHLVTWSLGHSGLHSLDKLTFS